MLKGKTIIVVPLDGGFDVDEMHFALECRLPDPQHTFDVRCWYEQPGRWSPGGWQAEEGPRARDVEVTFVAPTATLEMGPAPTPQQVEAEVVDELRYPLGVRDFDDYEAVFTRVQVRVEGETTYITYAYDEVV